MSKFMSFILLAFISYTGVAQDFRGTYSGHIDLFNDSRRAEIFFSQSGSKITGWIKTDKIEETKWDEVQFDMQKGQVLANQNALGARLRGTLNRDGAFDIELYWQNIGKMGNGRLFQILEGDCSIKERDAGPTECAIRTWVNAVSKKSYAMAEFVATKLKASGYIIPAETTTTQEQALTARTRATVLKVEVDNNASLGEPHSVITHFLVTTNYFNPTTYSQRVISALVITTVKTSENKRNARIVKVLDPDVW